VANLRVAAGFARGSLSALTCREASPGLIHEGEIAKLDIYPMLRLFLARPKGFDIRAFHRRLLATGGLPIHRPFAHLNAAAS